MSTSHSTGNTTASYSATTYSQKKVGKGRYSVVRYPEFIRASEHILDRYWVGQLEAASRGKFGGDDIYYENGLLIHRTKRSTRSVDLASLDDASIADEFRKFMRNNASLYSDIDMAHAEMVGVSDVQRRETVNVPDYLYSRMNGYVTLIATKYNFTESMVESLRQAILYGIRMGAINFSTVTMVNDEIVDIRGIEFDTTSCAFIISRSLIMDACARQAPPFSHDDVESDMFSSKCRKIKTRWKTIKKETSRLEAESYLLRSERGDVW